MMDDLDGYSCSDSGEDEVRFEEIRSEEEEELVGGCLLRIAFRGGNTAEAIEDEAENNRRVEKTKCSNVNLGLWKASSTM